MEMEQIEIGQVMIYIPQDIIQKIQRLSSKTGIDSSTMLSIILNTFVQKGKFSEELDTLIAKY